jgi:hypothetical protein
LALFLAEKRTEGLWAVEHRWIMCDNLQNLVVITKQVFPSKDPSMIKIAQLGMLGEAREYLLDTGIRDGELYCVRNGI